MAVTAGPVPDGVPEYFTGKQLKPSFNHQEVWAEEHALAYTVAKVTEADILQDYLDAVIAAAADGTSLREFSRDLRQVLQPKGWWGKRQVVDKRTGEVADVDFSEPYRLRRIYEVNLRMAYATQQWLRIQRNKKTHPYLLYLLGPSKVHREEHVQWHGLLLPVDDPFWLTHFTPNGYGCNCRIIAVTRAQYERLLVEGVPSAIVEMERDPQTGLPTGHKLRKRSPVVTTAPKITTRRWTNKETGEVLQVPKGIDPGFDYNPGEATRALQAGDIVRRKLPGYTDEIGQQLVRSFVEGPAFGHWLKRPVGAIPIAMMRPDLAAAVGAETRAVMVSAETMAKQRARHPELTPEEYELLPRMLSDGLVIQLDDQKLAFFRQEDRLYKAVLKSTNDRGENYLVSFYRADEAEERRDRRRGQVLQDWRK